MVQSNAALPSNIGASLAEHQTTLLTFPVNQPVCYEQICQTQHWDQVEPKYIKFKTSASYYRCESCIHFFFLFLFGLFVFFVVLGNLLCTFPSVTVISKLKLFTSLLLTFGSTRTDCHFKQDSRVIKKSYSCSKSISNRQTFANGSNIKDSL